MHLRHIMLSMIVLLVMPMASADMIVSKSESPPSGTDLLLGFDTKAEGSQNLLHWDRGQGAETLFGQTFRFDADTMLDKITVKIKPSTMDISGVGVLLWFGNAHHHVTDSRLTSMIAEPVGDLPGGMTRSVPWYVTLDIDDQLLAADTNYGFMLRFEGGGSGGSSSNEALLWAMGRYSYDDGAAIMYSGNWPSTLLNNDLVFFVQGSTVPEPTMLAILVCGALWLGKPTRRRRRGANHRA